MRGVVLLVAVCLVLDPTITSAQWPSTVLDYGTSCEQMFEYTDCMENDACIKKTSWCNCVPEQVVQLFTLPIRGDLLCLFTTYGMFIPEPICCNSYYTEEAYREAKGILQQHGVSDLESLKADPDAANEGVQLAIEVLAMRLHLDILIDNGKAAKEERQAELLIAEEGIEDLEENQVVDDPTFDTLHNNGEMVDGVEWSEFGEALIKESAEESTESGSSESDDMGGQPAWEHLFEGAPMQPAEE